MDEGSNDKGITITYTLYPECRQFKNWILMPGEKIREAKRIMRLKYLYRPFNPFLKDEIERYLWHGVYIELQEESKPTLKEGWSIRLNSERPKKSGLEYVLKQLNLPEQNQEVQKRT